MPRSAEAASLRFGHFELQPHERRLLVDGVPAALGARRVRRAAGAGRAAWPPGRQAELIHLVWPDAVVQENNLAAQVSALRKVLGDEIIATVPGRGYRFAAPLCGADEARDGARCPQPGVAAPRLRTNLPAGCRRCSVAATTSRVAAR